MITSGLNNRRSKTGAVNMFVHSPLIMKEFKKMAQKYQSGPKVSRDGGTEIILQSI